MIELVQEVTAEEVAQSYKAAMDSVNLINAGQPEGMTVDQIKTFLETLP